MEHLYSKPEELEKIINDQIDVNLKIDLAAFVFEIKNGKIQFYGREASQPINFLKKMTLDIYKNAIKLVESKKDELIAALPDGIKVFLEVYSPTLQGKEKPKILPKNGLFLSYSTINGRILRPTHELNKKIVSILDCSPPPVIFHGKLNSKQVELLRQFVENPNFKPFKEFFFELFPKAKEYKGYGLEGAVVYYDNSMLKIVDPEYTEYIKNKAKQKTEYQEYLESFVYDPNKLSVLIQYSLAQKPKDFFEFIEKLLFAVKIKFPEFYTETEKYKEERETTKFADLDMDLVPETIKAMFDIHWQNKDLFRIFVFLFSKEMKRTIPGTSPQLKTLVNNTLETLTYLEISRDFLFEAAPNPEEILAKLLPPARHKATLIPGRFQPPHLGHIKMAELAENYTVIIAVINTENNKNKKNFLPFSKQKEILYKYINNNIFPEGKNIVIEKYTNGFLPGVLHDLREKGYEVTEVIAGEDRLESYKKQLQLVNNVNHPNSYHITFRRAPRLASGTEVRAAIKNKDTAAYNQMMPHKVIPLSYFLTEEIRNEYEEWGIITFDGKIIYGSSEPGIKTHLQLMKKYGKEKFSYENILSFGFYENVMKEKFVFFLSNNFMRTLLHISPEQYQSVKELVNTFPADIWSFEIGTVHKRFTDPKQFLKFVFSFVRSV